MKLLFIDTETSGLPKDWKAPTTDVENWPRVIEFACIAVEVGNPSATHEHSAIMTCDFLIPEAASKVHGITDKIVKAEGLDRTEQLNLLFSNMKQADFICGHNVSYDKNCLDAEFHRLGFTVPEWKTFCTMLSTQKLFGKWPKLEQLFAFCKGYPMPEAHRALADIRATLDCAMYLNAHGLLKFPEGLK